MTSGYVLTETAQGELGELLHYVATNSGASRALEVHGRFVSAFEHLAVLPSAGSRRPNLTSDRIRWWKVYQWCVIYDPDPKPLVVLRVVHTRRLLSRLLQSEH